MSAFDQLVSVGGPSLAPPLTPGLELMEAEPLRPLLVRKNGFFAFDRALHVLPVSRSNNLLWWNSDSGWRATYPAATPQVFGFAMDVFGGQFGLLDGGVVYLNPELGEPEPLTDDLESWAALLLNDPALLGHPTVKDWTAHHGPLRDEQRLVPRIPFSLGGALTRENLRLCHTWEATQRYGRLAEVLQSLSNTATVHRSMLRDWLAPMSG